MSTLVCMEQKQIIIKRKLNKKNNIDSMALSFSHTTERLVNIYPVYTDVLIHAEFWFFLFVFFCFCIKLNKTKKIRACMLCYLQVVFCM